MVKQGSRFFRAQGRELFCASAIPLEGFDEGSLPADPFQVLGDRIRKVLTAAGVPWAFVGFDLSLNECPGAPTQYRPHAWIIAEKEGMKPAIKLLRRAFPSDSTTTPRPLVAMNFDGALPGIAYAFKPEFHRRVTTLAEKSKGGKCKRRNTRERDLLAHQKVEVMLAMDALGFEGRILLHGLEFQRTEKGWRLVMLGEKPT
ncbi:hypothetical protein FPV16_16780 [Methylobacterium sp. W2]|uniref:hypothetical protein n=1 Tax=Methylobacterium sp. W2 TaxID=2598107 RepID=UPI001D0C03F0|nr:hypothetical protein [Methylobacterium sp. W2]MCC0807860.1 hypothetical protein [Methylobacterium sp. W2]